MSDENVGGLVAKWRHMADRAGAESSADSASDELLAALRAEATAYRRCANMLEVALSAHGQPVVDEAAANRFCRRFYEICGYPVSIPRAYLLECMTAALEGADHE